MSDTGDKPYTWKVTGTRQTTALLPDQTVAQVVEVSYMLSNGHAGRVQVPLAGMTADTVRAAVDKAAAELYAVANLSG